MQTQDLKATIDTITQRLAQATDAAQASSEMQAYLAALAKFHKYSPGNIMLILSANPHASQVAGFAAWKKHNRWVRRGEHGIPILAPCFRKENPEDPESPQSLAGFRVVYVFDVAQTEGEPLPAPPDWISPARRLEVEARLLKFAESLGIVVERKQLKGNIQGSSSGGKIELAQDAGTKTLIHEIAHELLHKANRADHATMETEAESVAYIVATYLGIPGLNSPNYIALSGGTSETITKSLSVIQATAHRIIEAIDPTHENEAN
jgi:hypothetical protein